MIRLPDVDLPAESAQAAGEFSGVVEDLIDFKLAPVVETPAEHGGIRFRKAVVNRCRRVVIAGIDEKHPSIWRETAAYQRPEIGKALWGDVGERQNPKNTPSNCSVGCHWNRSAWMVWTCGEYSRAVAMDNISGDPSSRVR